MRGKPEKFADHYTQATLFWNSQSAVEKNHIVGAFRFELTKVRINGIRQRVVSMLANVDAELAARVADGIGIDVPPAQPRALENPPAPEVTQSKALSMFARPGQAALKTKRVALLVAQGVDLQPLLELHAQLVAAEALPRFIGPKLGKLAGADGAHVDVEVTFETAPSVLWDAVAVPSGEQALAELGHAKEFLKDQFRHCLPILLMAAKSALAEAIALPETLPDGSKDPGIAMDAAGFMAALGLHRAFEREVDPPRI